MYYLRSTDHRSGNCNRISHLASFWKSIPHVLRQLGCIRTRQRVRSNPLIFGFRRRYSLFGPDCDLHPSRTARSKMVVYKEYGDASRRKVRLCKKCRKCIYKDVGRCCLFSGYINHLIYTFDRSHRRTLGIRARCLLPRHTFHLAHLTKNTR